MTDIVERLRRMYVENGTNYVQEAADEIERLRAEHDAYVTAAMRDIAERDDVIERLRDLLSECRLALLWPGGPAQAFLDRIDAAMATQPTDKPEEEGRA